ncbi:hypothetical protein B5F76_07210 [Desulfovibrio sp. An276]|uniref:HesA/MoeB/ThiF family protein n=1 Tax=Desulfovibrio sp. An276 TaxID=1965618 RepID=UPI000B39894D|nr:ThiF family adenylyltransferase [Desulfovibrio sp. An276]OUO52442.1 hypothetical protein B5F76_07210 [Desulfovibrio sp. An276]
MNFTRQDFCNFLVSNFPWKWKDGSLDVETDTPLFVENTFIANWARREGVRVPDAMAALLDINVWPERFRQNCDVYSKEQMQRLLQARVAIAGLGGLGGRVTELLARLGVCHFTLCDCDEFSESNLNRQAFCTEKSIGWRKTTTLELAVSDIAEYARVRRLSLALDERTIPDFLENADIVFDCLDDIQTKALLERACAAANIPFVHGGVSHQEGFAFATRGECGLARLYGEELPQKPKRQPVSVLAVAGTACMMVSLGLRVLFGEQTDDQQAGKLYHQDFGELAMDAFDFGA